jgi:hypothetical protein
VVKSEYFVAIIISILVLGSLVAAKAKYNIFTIEKINVGKIFTRLDIFISVIRK